MLRAWAAPIATLLLLTATHARADEERTLLVSARADRVWLSRGELAYEPRLEGEADASAVARLRRWRGQKLNPAYSVVEPDMRRALGRLAGRRVTVRAQLDAATRTARVADVVSPVRRELVGFLLESSGQLQLLRMGGPYTLVNAPPALRDADRFKEVEVTVRAWVFPDKEAVFEAVAGRTRRATAFKRVRDGAVVEAPERVSRDVALWASPRRGFTDVFEVWRPSASGPAGDLVLEREALVFGETSAAIADRWVRARLDALRAALRESSGSLRAALDRIDGDGCEHD